MSIPLVQKAEKDDINTSIIAIKRNIERINMLLGLSNSEEIDTSVFATKEELEDTKTQIETDLAPVDSVTLNNMHSVTSNAVAGKVSEIKSSLEWKILNGNDIKNIPNDYTEIGISIYFAFGTDQVLASKVFARDMLETGRTQRVFIDGYYYSAGDYGLINVTNTSGVITLRNVIYIGSDYKSSANLRIRYR